MALSFVLVLCVGSLAFAGDKFKRSSSAKSAFKKLHPCPSTGSSKGRCPGYVIDHVLPLACGGADAPENMQWQTVADAKEKDRRERRDCVVR